MNDRRGRSSGVFGMVPALRQKVRMEPAIPPPEMSDSPSGSAACVLSVVIPTLDEGKRLAGLLDRFTPELRRRLALEVVVSDGGSQDDTCAIARSRADRLVAHPKGQPQTIAEGRNAGARAARGDVLLFFNADVALPAELEAFLEALREAALADGAATCRVLVEPDRATWADAIVIGACNRIFRAMNRIGVGMGRGECQAVRRDLFEAVGGYREDLVAGEDFDLFHRLTRRFRQTGGGRVRFLWEWVVYEDPRRYRRLGYPRTMWSWFKNFVSVWLRGRSVSEAWEPVR